MANLMIKVVWILSYYHKRLVCFLRRADCRMQTLIPCGQTYISHRPRHMIAAMKSIKPQKTSSSSCTNKTALNSLHCSSTYQLKLVCTI